ncbi:MAG: dipeptidase [Anaerolineales bacterium]|jgi:acetylornithine deacetylase/succinyl-diaminopimelate desuccinylase-like protein|nr:dipeptidase [Anaerolineales bacterium]
MSQHLNAALEYARQHEADFLNVLREVLAFGSISTSDEHRDEIQKTAQWVARRLEWLGLQNVAVMPTERHPVVYGEWLGAPGKPTMLIYGHYDVQPVDPLELWQTGPFSPTLKGENLYARGASDMKGQVIACLNALEAVMQTGKLPINVKFLIEGEEEIGSPSLPKWIEANKELLKADFCLNPDAGMLGKDHPTITYGLRGLAAFELTVSGPDHDLHSGVFGGTVHNPAKALVELLAGMHDQNNHITLPGYYDRVRPLSAEERASLAKLPVDDGFIKAQTGVPEVWGEAGYTSVERAGGRPTLEINGMISGFTGQGQKTIIPAWAMAKITCRLVPDQDPDEVYEQFKAYLEAKAPKTIHWDLKMFGGGRASISDLHKPWVTALSDAMQTVWGTAPLFKREGGSVPVVGMMQEILGMESVLTGFGLPDDNLHAPNEKTHLPTWYKGTETLIRFFFNL